VFYPFMPLARRRRSSSPDRYGYPVCAKDFWVLNYMIHDLISTPANI